MTNEITILSASDLQASFDACDAEMAELHGGIRAAEDCGDLDSAEDLKSDVKKLLPEYLRLQHLVGYPS